MSQQMLLATLACLLVKESASVCRTTGREYQTDEVVQIWCPRRPGTFYPAKCQANGQWDHAARDTQCPLWFSPNAQQGVSAMPPPSSTATPTVAASARPAAAAAVCVYDPRFMKAQDENGVFPESFAYQTRCLNSQKTFEATCRNREWVFDENVCAGQATNFLDQLNNLFKPILNPNPVESSTLRSCPYLPDRMTDSSSSFSHGARYRFTCTSPAYQGRFYFGECVDGTWKHDESNCERKNILEGFSDLFGNIFQRTTPSPTGNFRSCPYLPDRMTDGGSSSPFSHGARYRFTCTSPAYQGRFYFGECVDGTWKHDESNCERKNILEGFTNLFGNLFQQTTPSPTGVVLKSCQFQPETMRASDAEQLFPHNSRYQFPCTSSPVRGRSYWGTCNNGKWDHDESLCGNNNPLQNFGQSVNNLLGTGGNFPWWIALG